MQVSAAGLALIEESEGWSPGPYLDRVASPPVWTAYFGETKGIGPTSPHITRAQGERRLKSRFAADYAHALAPFVNLDGFTQHMYDALASFIWNCGSGAVSASTTVGKRLRARDWDGAATALMAWCKNGAGQVIPGLQTRRERERKLFLTSVGAADWLEEDELRWVREFDALERLDTTTAAQQHRKEVLVRVMTARRKSIYHEANKPGGKGWSVNNRTKRYKSLKARTT